MRTLKVLLSTALLLSVAFFSGCAKSAPDVDNGQHAGNETPDQAAPPAAEETGTQYVVVKEGSSAQYEVGEKFASMSLPTTAIGSTAEVEGTLVLGDNGELKASSVRVDVSTLTSDSERRDMMVGSALRFSEFQFAEYNMTGMTGADSLPVGAETAFQLTGNMKLVGVERPLVFDAKARLDGDTLHLTATTTLSMADFGIDPPSIMGFVTVNDEVELTVTIKAQKQSAPDRS